MRLTSVLAGIVALFVALTLLMYVVSPSTIRATPGGGAVVDNAAPLNEAVDGKYRINPFEFSESGPFPKAQLDSLEHNFGQMPVGATGRHTFHVTNAGDAPLKLARGESSCKCTVGTLGQDEVPPGGTAEIQMEWEPPGRTLEFMQVATIWTNDPQKPEVKLSIVGQVVPEVITYPEGAWTVTVNEHSATQFRGMILAMLQDSFEITAIETSQPWITVTPRLLTLDEAKRDMGKSGYELNCEIQPEMPVGPFTETITVKTTIAKHAEFQFQISGSRLGPFHIVGPGWFPPEGILRMGRIRSADGRLVKLSLFATERDPPLQVEVESVEPPLLSASVERKALDAAAASRLQFVVNLDVPQGIAPGRYVDDQQIRLRLKTNHPDAPTVLVNVELQAE